MRTEPIRSGGGARHPRPQEEWKEIIAVYLYLAGMGAGAFIIGTLIQWLGVTFSHSFFITVLGIHLDLTTFPLLWGPIMVAIGAPFLILDLGIKSRFMYACLNPRTSWVARGFLILSVFITFGLIHLVKSVLTFEWLHPESAFWRIPEVIAFVFAFGTALYTGILLKATKSVPLWNTYLLPLLFLVSALSTGSMAIVLSTLAAGLLSHDGGVMRALIAGEQVLVVIEGIVLYLYLSQRHAASEQGKDSVRLLLFGEKRLIFWGGIVLLGFVFPVILESVAAFFDGNVALIFASGLILLCGGFFLRLGILSAGIKERLPMKRWMEVQYGIRAMETKGD